ncbi:unnamed protein product (macronuclear) [Paramecium tetraurelia]|uniref:Casein kinase I n=1 Tax=Paramecium tetraurelia TaxID=5888 RepID=A0C0S0_PARTE|nr:uncharacterized protein GSPATT00033863001 [Paramecium tetraurelia]CAK64387.1 unnamed protein product [Paramecium tetraurelia]|eukprot:XP_001431785.1 hypothetical protein (macronuclear) [Paramecium tetraurelia strain d4-2]
MYLQNSNYKILSTLGAGSGHQVLKVKHNQTSQILALKMEKNPNLGQLEGEIKKLKELAGTFGIPQLIDYGKTQDQKSYLITPLLKKNLHEITKDHLLSQRQIIAIGLSLINILQQIHKKDILHLDIKPENIMISQPFINVPIDEILKPGFMYLIDFGLSQKIGLRPLSNKVFVGSLRYASRQAHKGNALGYKDDLESLLYVLVNLRNCNYYVLFLENLPWQSLKQQQTQQMEIKKIGEMKDAIFNTLVLSQKFPPQFQLFKSYIETLTQKTMPDYDYIKNLFKQMLSIGDQSTSAKLSNSVTLSQSIRGTKQNKNNDQIMMLLANIPNNDSIHIPEDQVDTETSIVYISDLISSYPTFSIKSITDIKY